MKRIRLVIFDLDGTLLDTLSDIRNAINYVLKCYDMKSCSLDDVRRYVGHGFANALKAAIDEKGGDLDDEEFALALSLLRRYYQNNADKDTVRYPGMNDLLLSLISKGIQVAVLTNKDDEVAKKLMKEFYPDVSFTFVEGKRVARSLKPDSALTLSLLEEYGFKSDEVIIVGDSEVDFQTAENIGSPAVIVSYGFRTADELRDSGIRKTVSDTDALRRELSHFLFA